MRKLLSFLLAIVIMFSLPLSSFAILPSQVTNPMITFGDDVIEVRSANVGIWTNEERAFLAEFISNENTFIDVYSSYICLRIFHDSSASYRLNSDGTSCSISKVDGSRLNYTSMFITANGDASGLYLDDISRSFSISPILTPILSANFFDKNGLTLPNTHFVQYDHSGVMFYYTAGFKPDFKPN